MKILKKLHPDLEYSEHWADEIREDISPVKFIFCLPNIDNNHEDEDEFKEWSSF